MTIVIDPREDLSYLSPVKFNCKGDILTCRVGFEEKSLDEFGSGVAYICVIENEVG